MLRDQSLDLSGSDTYRLLNHVEAPEWVKSASSADLCGDPATLRADRYADGLHRRLPCHTKAATWMSAVFLADQRPELDEREYQQVEANLTKWAKFWHIGEAVKTAMAAVADSKVKDDTHIPDRLWGLVIRRAGQTERHFPMRNATEVVKAASYLQEHAVTFDRDDRRQFASRILELATEHGARLGELNDFVERQAGLGTGPVKSAAALLRGRAVSCGNRELSDEMEKFANRLEREPDLLHDPTVREKVAAIVDQVDKITSLQAYSPSRPAPEDVLYQVNSSFIDNYEHTTVKIGSAMYAVEDIAAIPRTEIRDWVGDKVAERLQAAPLLNKRAAARIMEELEGHEAVAFKQLLATRQVKPLLALPTAGGLTPAALYRLADSFVSPR